MNKTKQGLLDLFNRCLSADYIQVGNHSDYSFSREKNHLYIYLQWSNGIEDWKANFSFGGRPYHQMQTTWCAHRGFIETWKGMEGSIGALIQDTTIQQITIVGYSHGGALCVFAHEYCWYHRPDLRNRLNSYAFAAPKVVCGGVKEIEERFKKLFLIQNIGDIVTSLPPKILGYHYVGERYRIGVKYPYNFTLAVRCHYAQVYQYYLSDGKEGVSQFDRSKWDGKKLK